MAFSDRTGSVIWLKNFKWEEYPILFLRLNYQKLTLKGTKQNSNAIVAGKCCIFINMDQQLKNIWNYYESNGEWNDILIGEGFLKSTCLIL